MTQSALAADSPAPKPLFFPQNPPGTAPISLPHPLCLWLFLWSPSVLLQLSGYKYGVR